MVIGSVMLRLMTTEGSSLLSTLLALPDEERRRIEAELVPLGRRAALGDLAADVAHDVANPLFGVLGLVDLLLDGVPPGSIDEERLRLLRETALEMKGTLRALLDFARPAGSEPAEGDLAAAAREALGLVRHGSGRTLQVDERYGADPAPVACPPALLVQAALHLLLGARAAGGAITVEVEAGRLRVAPAANGSIDLLVARAIAVACGGTLEREPGAATLVVPGLRESRAGSSAD
jgi:two-component system, NtrC family, sensor kinase